MRFNKLALILIIVLLDQLTKIMALTGTILFDTKMLAFNLVKNTGSSFGLFRGANTILIFISIIVLGAILFHYRKLPENEKIWMAVATAGILGNFIDRIWHGYVVDFIDFKIWPVFNIADICIVVGVIMLIHNSWENHHGSSNKKSKS